MCTRYVQCVVFRLARESGVGAAAAVTSFVTNPSCGLRGLGPGTYTQPGMAPDGTITTWNNHSGTPGDTNDFTTENDSKPEWLDDEPYLGFRMDRRRTRTPHHPDR